MGGVLRRAAAAAAVTLLGLSSGCATLDRQGTWAVTPCPSAAVPDLTGDGVADLAGNDGNNALHYYRGDGHAGLTDAGTAWAGFGPWWGYTRITVADFNGDGHADIAGVDPYGDLRVFFGDGNGHWFGGQLMWPAGGNWTNFKYLAAGDFNSDGKADIVSYADDGNPRLFAGDGAGHVTGPPTMGLPAGAFTGFADIVAGDFNGDGLWDIAAVNASHDLGLYLGDGTGHLTAVGAGVLMWPGGGQFTRRIAAGDYNGDGFLDVAQITASGALALYAGDGTGHLRTGTGQPATMSTPGVWWTNHRPAGTPSSGCWQGRTVIMPLGDSITYGTASSTGDGYRAPLATLLGGSAPMGSGWLYEGSINSGSSFWSHEGHGGYTIDQLNAGLSGWLPAAGNARLPVNLILLDAGTNDSEQNRTGAQMLTSMSTLLDSVHTADPAARVLVAQITITGLDTPAQQQAEQDFDNGLPALAAAKGTWVRTVDMRGVALSGDQLHPGDAGYQDMAGRWYAALMTAGWLP